MKEMGIFLTLTGGMVLWMFTFIKAYQAVHFKHLEFIVCQLDLNKGA